jgi:4'-phosphopantetheinyl transferase
VRFNLAHGGELALIAVSLGCDVGIDVEPLRAVSRFEQIAARYFHPAEAAELLTAPVGQRATAFLRCWTGKEAVLKAVGVGLGFGLERVRVPLSEHNGAWISTGDSRSTTPLGIKSLIRSPKSEIASCWLVPLSPAEDYIGALACVGEQRRLSLRSLRM